MEHGFRFPRRLSFSAFDFFPPMHDLIGIHRFFIGDGVVEHMRVTSDEFVAELLNDIVDRKCALFGRDLTMEQYLEKYVPQLFL